MVCERCWAEFSRRQAAGEAVTYQEILAANDGRCTPADMCGERHDLVNGIRCRCGARPAPSSGADATTEGGRDA